MDDEIKGLSRVHQRRYIWLVLAISLCVIIFFGYGHFQQVMPFAPETQRQSIRIGYAIEPPYAYLNEQQRVTGESPETARQIADILGIKDITWVALPFAQLIPALQNRQIDLIASGLFISRERQQHVRFSLPTLKVYPGLLVPADSQQSFSTDFQENLAAELRFVVIDGSVEAAKLAQLNSPVNSLTVSDLAAALDSLQYAGSDALLLSVPTLQWLTGIDDKYQLIKLDSEASKRLPADYVAFAFHRDDAALFTAWNAVMRDWVGSQQHLDTIAPFGFDRQDVVMQGIR